MPDSPWLQWPGLALSLVLNLIPRKSDQSLLPNWVICAWVVTNKTTITGVFFHSFVLAKFTKHQPLRHLCRVGSEERVLSPCACPPRWRILGIEVHSEFVVEFSWHDRLRGRFFTSRLAQSAFSHWPPFQMCLPAETTLLMFGGYEQIPPHILCYELCLWKRQQKVGVSVSEMRRKCS